MSVAAVDSAHAQVHDVPPNEDASAISISSVTAVDSVHVHDVSPNGDALMTISTQYTGGWLPCRTLGRSC